MAYEDVTAVLPSTRIPGATHFLLPNLNPKQVRRTLTIYHSPSFCYHLLQSFYRSPENKP